MGPIAVRETTGSAAVLNHHSCPPFKAQVHRVKDTPAASRPITGHLVNVEAAQAVRAVVAHHGTPREHGALAVCTLKCLISPNGIGPDLCTGRPIEQHPHQAAPIQTLRPCNAACPRQVLRDTSSLWILVQHTAQRLDLTARAGLLESGFQQFKVHER